MNSDGAGSRDAVLQSERAVNELYRDTVRKDRAKWQRTQSEVASQTNTSWHRSPSNRRQDAIEVLPIIGRVGLTDAHDGLGSSFYIGQEHCELAEAEPARQVVSWTAPVASAFFVGPCDTPHELVGPVCVTRTFAHDGLDVTDFDDDTVNGEVDPHEVFTPDGTGGGLAVTAFPGRIKRPTRRPTPPVGDAPATTGSDVSELEPETATAPEKTVPDVAPAPAPAEPPVPARQAAGDDAAVALRAERLVRTAISAPRTGRLGSVLSTLQGNQYELVTWPADESIVIEGSPGTGKTIVATHRAAYLIDPSHNEPDSKPGLPLDSVTLVGPSTAWASHVQSSLDELGAGAVQVFSIDSMIQKLAGSRIDAEGPRVGSRIDTTDELVLFLRRVTERYVERSGKGDRVSVKAVMKDLFSNRAHRLKEFRAGEDVHAWVDEAKTWNRVRSEGRYIQALAVVGSTLGRRVTSRRFAHIVVDEAQDLSPMEWWLVNRLGNYGVRMTVVGDLQQRRTDWSPMTWSELDETVELSDGIRPLTVRTLDTAYRSTRQILRFAGQLLPKGSPTPRALQTGPEVVVVRDEVQPVETVVDQVHGLIDEYPDALAAVITTEATPVIQAFRKHEWRRPSGSREVMVRDDRRLWIGPPDRARGLEFDIVVVVEPSAFPENLGRSGPLYTSLTRATKALAVVHAKPLPRNLRPPR